MKAAARSKSNIENQGYDDFEEIDRARKVLLHTQACDGTWRLLLSLAPSVLPYVFLSADFWLSVFIYVITRLLLVYKSFEPMALGDFRGLETMGVLLGLMLSFYTNTCIERMFETNHDAMELLRCLNDFAFSMRGYLWDNPEQQDITRRCVDYLNAAHVFGYVGFTDQYTTENLWEGFNAEFGVLTDEEVTFVKSIPEEGGDRQRECVAWCMEEIHLAVQNKFLPPPVANGFNNMVHHFNDHVQSLYDFKDLPIPFVVEHLLVFFVHIYLPVATFEMAVQTQNLKNDSTDAQTGAMIEVFGCVLALLANIGFQGLFAVGAFLESPYGSALYHSRVSTFCRLAIKASRKTIGAFHPRRDSTRLLEAKAELVALHKELRANDIKVNKDVGLRVLQDLVNRSRAAEPSLLPWKAS